MEKYEGLDQKPSSKYSRERYQRWKQLGLCSNCGKKREKGYKRCRRCRLRQVKWFESNSLTSILTHKEYRARLKLEAFSAYGGTRCSCCRENEIEFLTIDHIEGRGNQHRKEVGRGWVFYLWLRRNKYPKGYRVLCMNCNFSLGVHGYCPHQRRIT